MIVDTEDTDILPDLETGKHNIFGNAKWNLCYNEECNMEEGSMEECTMKKVQHEKGHQEKDAT